MEVVTDDTALSIDDIKKFEPMFKNLSGFKKQPIRTKNGIVIPIFGQ